MLGFEPRTFCMQSRRSTTELHPLPGCLGLDRVVNEDMVIAATHVQISFKITCLKQNNFSSSLQKLVNTSLNVDQLKLFENHRFITFS